MDWIEFKGNRFGIDGYGYWDYYVKDIDVQTEEVWLPVTFKNRAVYGIKLPQDKVYNGVKVLYIPGDMKELEVTSSNFPELVKTVCTGGADSYFTTDGRMVFSGKGGKLHACLVNDGKSITVPGSVKEICSKAFYGTCYSEINFPYNNMEIAADAFDNSKWSGLQEDYVIAGSVLISSRYKDGVLKVPENVKKFNRGFLSECNYEKIICSFMPSLSDINSMEYYNKLKSYHITSPSAVINIKNLKEMEWLSEVVIADNHPLYSTRDGVVYSADGQVLVWYPSAKEDKEFYIPDGVKKIGRSAFAGQNYLRKLVVPDSVKVIGASAFYQCTEIEEIYLPDGIKEIPDSNAYQRGGVFEGCSSLSYIKLPEHLEYLGSFAFYESWLSSIEIGSHLEQIGEYGLALTELDDVKLPAPLKRLGKGSLLHIGHVTAYEGTAGGLPAAVNATNPYMKDNAANLIWQRCEVSVLGKDGKIKETFLIPGSLNRNLACCLDAAWNGESIDYSEYDECFTGIKDTDEKLEFAENRLSCLNDDMDNPFASYVKRVSGKIAYRLLEHRKEKEFLEFASRGFLSQAALKKLIKYSNEQGLVVCSAYIAQILNKDGGKKKKSSFRL